VSARVSVLLPVRNAETTLAASLRSVSRQRLSDFECIVVDDGSRDASLAIARRHAHGDPRFRVFAEPARGLVPALARGLAECRAPFVARHDADDCMHRDRLSLQVAALDAAPRLAGVGCHVRLFPRGALGAGMRAYERWLAGVRTSADVRREAFVECPLAHPTLLLRRDLLVEHGYRDDAGWPEDYDLVLRWLAAGLELGVVARRLLAWRHGPARLSQRSPVYAPDRFTACKAHYLAHGLLARERRYWLWGYGGTGRALAKALRAHDRHPDAIVELHPRRIGQRIQGAPVIAPKDLGAPGTLPLVVSVAGADARALIRADLEAAASAKAPTTCARRNSPRFPEMRRWIVAFGSVMAIAAPLLGSDPRAPALRPVVGREESAVVAPGETLLDVAYHRRLGYQAIERLNSGVDPWIPKPGTVVRLPTRYILPDADPDGLVVNIPEMRLFDFTVQFGPEVFALAVGDEADPSLIGDFKVGAMRKDPAWRVPKSIRADKPELPSEVPPGPDNPLGSRWITIGTTSYGIHGTNVRWSIGREATHGCLRLYEDDIRRLYDRVREGTRIQIVYQTAKWGRDGAHIFLEAHPDLYGLKRDRITALDVPRALGLLGSLDLEFVLRTLDEARGEPVRVGTVPAGTPPTSSPTS
jgi:lipoprotein-anchoring transpeptidase ErfK/SrfK/glycosyltransferase involved in cell wall biosynthesis